VLLLGCASLFAASDAEIQAAIERGFEQPNTEKLFKQIEKRHTLRINRGGIGDTVGKSLVFVSDLDWVSILSSEAHRRHMPVTVAGVKAAIIRGVPVLGITRVLLVSQTTDMYADNLPKWSAPRVQVLLTVDGHEIQPFNQSGPHDSETSWGKTEHGVVTNNGGFVSYTPLYTSSLYDMLHSSAWFLFQLPENASAYSATVISGDGHEKHKEFSADLLR
jgi:hypothetical protein